MHQSTTRWIKVAPVCAVAVLMALPGCAPWGQTQARMNSAWNSAIDPWREFGQETANALSPDGNGVANEARELHSNLDNGLQRR
ncbi:MAG: hypothetical protein MPJ50_09665 [Pirellulales bacterium]|nr:hypothetical protein [Pirellulales bacterium]